MGEVGPLELWRLADVGGGGIFGGGALPVGVGSRA